MLTEFHTRFEGGKRWRLTPEGIEVEGQGVTRSKGEPVTVTTLWDDYGEDILHASWEVGCPVDMVVAMIPIEAVRFPGSRSFDPRSNRFEPGYISDEETPHRRSPGLMQTLLSTADDMAERIGLEKEITTELLFDPFYSILLGGAYITRQVERYGPDPVLICGAYNAGSVRKTDKNPWKIRTYGPTRMDRYVQWFNDFHYAVQAGLIELPEGTLLSLPTDEAMA